MTYYHHYSYRFLKKLNHPSARLVHGELLNGKTRIPHAWVELGKWVFDATTKTILYDHKEFYATNHVHSVKKYDLPKATLLGLKYKTFGPWEGGEK